MHSFSLVCFSEQSQVVVVFLQDNTSSYETNVGKDKNFLLISQILDKLTTDSSGTPATVLTSGDMADFSISQVHTVLIKCLHPVSCLYKYYTN